MVIDSIQALDKYASLNPRFPAAFAFLREMMAKEFAVGHYVMPNCDAPESVFINAFQYDTKVTDEAICESHRKYIDIQIILEGKEKMYVPADATPAPSMEYNPEKDVIKYAPVAFADAHAQLVTAGHFAIFFENELHAPNGAVDAKPSNVRKFVLKVLA